MSSPEKRSSGSAARILCAPPASLRVSGSASQSSSSAPRVPSGAPVSKASSGMREGFWAVVKVSSVRLRVIGCAIQLFVYINLLGRRWVVSGESDRTRRSIVGRAFLGEDGAAEQNTGSRKFGRRLRRDRSHPGLQR